MKRVILAAGLAVSLSACATITKGTEDTVRLNSQPEGAKVTFVETRGKLADQQCQTPCVMELNRKWDYKVTFELDGYKSVEGLLEPKLSGDGAAGMAGNVLIGGIVGAAIDGSTGAMNDLKPNPMVAILAEEGSDLDSFIQNAEQVKQSAKAATEKADDIEEEVEEVEAEVEDVQTEVEDAAEEMEEVSS
ncbi:MAG: translation initiation factor 2 [Pseudomonadota bacterium]